MSLQANSEATLDTENDDDGGDDEWRFSRTGHYHRDALYVTTDPRHLTENFVYRFRWIGDETVIAPLSATWHAVEYVREVLNVEVLTPGIHDRQRMLRDFDT